MGADRTAAAQEGAAVPLPRSTSGPGPPGPVRDPVRPAHRHPVGTPPQGTRLRLRDDVLAPTAGLEPGRRLAAAPRDVVGRAQRGRPARLVPLRSRLLARQGAKRGLHTGPSPVDRGRAGSKHHVITDGHGTPLAVLLTGGNRNDVTQLMPLLDAIPPVRGRVGHPRRKPDSLFADRGYDHDIYRDQVRARGIVPAIARRNTRHGTGLGVYRWVVERTFAWLHGFRRLRVRWERRADIHEAFLKLACCLITHRQIRSLCEPPPDG